MAGISVCATFPTMKLLALFLLLTLPVIATDDEWRSKFLRGHVSLYGAGPCPVVTSERLPGNIVSAIRERLKDPSSAEFVSWSVPVFSSTHYAGTRVGFWVIDVKVRARNSYGAYVTGTYTVTVNSKEVRVTRP